MLIAVINESSLVSNIEAALMTQACQIQNSLHCSSAWNQKPATIAFYSDVKKVPGYAWLISIIDDDASVPGALGYHTENNGRVVGFIMAKPVLDAKGVVLYDSSNPQNYTVSSVLSHEVCESFVMDRFCNLYADGPRIAQGSQYAVEVCDPVESDSYAINVNGTLVSVSNFIFESWINPKATAPTNLPFDYMHKLTAPFTMSVGGYMVVRNTGRGSETQVFAESYPEWRKALKKSALTRRNRRKSK